VPTTTDARERSQFFAARGAAFHSLGRESEAIAELRRTIELARSAGEPTYRLLTTLASAEERGGEVERALEAYRAAARQVPDSDRGWLFAVYPREVWISARMGDLTAAQATLNKLVQLEGESRGWPGIQPEPRASWQAGIATSRAAIAEARGDADRGSRVPRGRVTPVRRSSPRQERRP
jgi:tetratricopeptide (TPR) repeat protein